MLLLILLNSLLLSFVYSKKATTEALVPKWNSAITNNSTASSFLNDAQNIYEELFVKRIYYRSLSPINTRISKHSSPEEKFLIIVRLQHFYIVQLDSILQILTAYAQLQMLWIDPRLSWDPRKNGDIEMIYVDCGEVWIPDEMIVSSIQVRDIYQEKKKECKIYANGTVEQDRTVTLDLACLMDMRMFPFDYQKCGISYASQVYSWREIRIVGELFEKYKESCMKFNYEVDVINTSIAYTYCDGGDDREAFNTVSFYMVLRRKPYFYIYVVAVPCFLLTFLSVTGGFWTPNLREEQLMKLSIALTSMMSMTTFVNIISQEMPKTTHFPLLGIFVLTCIFITSIASVILVIFPERIRKSERNKTQSNLREKAVNFFFSTHFCFFAFFQLANITNFVVFMSFWYKGPTKAVWDYSKE